MSCGVACRLVLCVLICCVFVRLFIVLSVYVCVVKNEVLTEFKRLSRSVTEKLLIDFNGGTNEKLKINFYRYTKTN